MTPTPTIAGKVAYFAPDLSDPAVHRRVAQWRHAGHDIAAFAFSRNHAGTQDDDSGGFISLGRLSHQSRLTRPIALARALARLWRRRQDLDGVQLYVARNLDNAVLALLARRIVGSNAPLVYEVLDIHGSCIGSSRSARLLRRIEKWLLARTDLLVVSSPYYISSYYLRYYSYTGRWLLFENKIPRHARLSRRAAEHPPRSKPWRIGWFGYLDDERGWAALRALAERFPTGVEVCVRGRPYSNFDMNRFMADVDRLQNVSFGGAYKSPDDLADLYGSVDMVWSVDLNDPKGNSRWLLTNATYEALYFGKPLVSVADTAVGQFVADCNAGWCLADRLEDSLIDLFGGLTEADYALRHRAIADIPMDRLVESNEIERIFNVGRPIRADIAIKI